jgi:hypothetical protein
LVALKSMTWHMSFEHASAQAVPNPSLSWCAPSGSSSSGRTPLLMGPLLAEAV